MGLGQRRVGGVSRGGVDDVFHLLHVGKDVQDVRVVISEVVHLLDHLAGGAGDHVQLVGSMKFPGMSGMTKLVSPPFLHFTTERGDI